MVPGPLENEFVVADRSGRDRAQSLVDLGYCQVVLMSHIEEGKK
jgi:hypothetical protein